MSEEAGDDSESLVSGAIIVACIVGIVIVAALIIVSPQEKEPFTQLWFKPWKLNLTDLPEGDPIIDAVEEETTSMMVGVVLGNRFYLDPASLQIGLEAHLIKDMQRRPFSKAFGAYVYSEGDTISLDPNSVFLDAIDTENGQILFWEYPRVLYIRRPSPVRFAFVIENNLGEDHEYEAKVNLSIGTTIIEKISKEILVKDGQQKTCVVQFLVTPEDGSPIIWAEEDYGKVTVKLDTGEEIFFWVGRNI